jgi:transcriptional regulator with XRE-family HTH domain
MKLSQDEVGKQLGASAIALSRWERGIQYVPSTSTSNLEDWLAIRFAGISGDVPAYALWT